MTDEHNEHNEQDEHGEPEHGELVESAYEDAPSLGGFDLGSLLGAAQTMQSQMVEAQQRIAATMVEGSSGGGAVVVSVSGGYQFERVRIAAEVVDAANPAELEDLVLAALRDATSKVEALHAQSNPLGGLDLGDLGGLGGLGGLLGGA